MVSERTKEHTVSDEPPYSRLFVVYNRKDPLTEAELRNDFSKFGDVQDVFIVRDKSTGESKGVAYVKFPKMSEAALAMEKMNNTPIKGHSGVYKVYIAKSRGEARGPDHDPERYLRLFIMVPKSATEEDIRHYFTKFGEVTTVKLLRHKDTNESKGLGYVTYGRVYDAAKAVESGENELGYKAVIARPKEKSQLQPQQQSQSQHQLNDSGYSSNYSSYAGISHNSNNDLHPGGDSFQATVSAKLDKDHIFRLFDIAPGLRNIQITSQNVYRVDIIATYTSALAAEYALNKLQGLEYPLGECICVESKGVNKPIMATNTNFSGAASTNFSGSAGSNFSGNAGSNFSGNAGTNFSGNAGTNFSGNAGTNFSGSASGSISNFGGSASGNMGSKRDYRGEQIVEQRSISPVDPNREVNQKLSALTKALSDATTLLKTAGISTAGLPTAGLPNSGIPTENLGFEEIVEKKSSTSTYCNFQLPPLQKVLPKSVYNESTGMRLFFVAHPSAPPLDALNDVYCRFGNFAGASILQRKNYGYLYFTSAESALRAIEATDDKLIAGTTIKVLPAEPKGEPGSKRKKTEM